MTVAGDSTLADGAHDRAGRHAAPERALPPPPGVREHPGFTAVAWAATGRWRPSRQPGDRFLVGVQWHPEVVADAGLFRALVEAARRS